MPNSDYETLKPWRRNCLQNDSEFKETRGKVLAEDFEMQLLSELVYVTASPLPGDTSGKADKEFEMKHVHMLSSRGKRRDFLQRDFRVKPAHHQKTLTVSQVEGES